MDDCNKLIESRNFKPDLVRKKKRANQEGYLDHQKRKRKMKENSLKQPKERFSNMVNNASQLQLNTALSFQSDIGIDGFRIENGESDNIKIIGGETRGVFYGVTTSAAKM
jgi:hypothetical protein